jgi:NAD(P)-dependent dehydrogenase (short-subunit alcohol dehydrogenase family)
MGLLEGQRIIITGAGSGIGAATARRMHAEGADLALLDRETDAVERLGGELDAYSLTVDVADTDALNEAFVRAADGLGHLHAVFNDAGVGNLKPLHTYTEDEWDLLVDVNLKGTWNGIRAAVPLLRQCGGGSIVNMASVSGIFPTRGEGPYAAAKAGTIALTRSAALEYGPDGIRVNCVAPGFIRTSLTEFAFDNPAWVEPLERRTPLRRAGTADDVAKVAVFLCSDLAGYVTGQTVVVDGGSMLPNAQVDHLLLDLLGESET